MTYEQLLEETQAKKEKAIKELNSAINGELGWLAKAEIERKPGTVAWLWLAKDFCEAVAQNIDELMEGEDELTQRELYDIYVAYENDESYLYEILPVEAQLFTE